MRAKKAHLNLEARLPRSDDMDKRLGDAGVDVLAYDKRYGRYKLRLDKDAVGKHAELLSDVLRRARGGAA